MKFPQTRYGIFGDENPSGFANAHLKHSFTMVANLFFSLFADGLLLNLQSLLGA
jgi:hypothetical protein